MNSSNTNLIIYILYMTLDHKTIYKSEGSILLDL